jgi:AcrR family transcriptional regulator
MDKRIIQTKSKLKNALILLLEDTDLCDITVSRLCSQAHVNRSTFYVYYGNVTECFDEIADAIIEEMRRSLYREPDRSHKTYLRIYFQTARKYKSIFRAIHRMGIHNTMIHKMVDVFNEVFHNQIYIPSDSEHLEYSYLFSGFYGMVEVWLTNGCKQSDEELIEILESFIYTVQS